MGAMSCVPVSPAMRQLLEAFRDYPVVDVAYWRDKHEWADAVRWGG